jgi:recombination DNA repair RAD52 pathway protein
MEKDSIPARAKQIEAIDEILPNVTLIKDPNVGKSVPLAALTPVASKIPSPQRINALKDALAKAMAVKVESPESKVESQEKNKIQTGIQIQTSGSIQVTRQSLVQIQQSNNQPQPAEVPEDVLKKTLKI